jgi:hypothetical protein
MSRQMRAGTGPALVSMETEAWRRAQYQNLQIVLVGSIRERLIDLTRPVGEQKGGGDPDRRARQGTQPAYSADEVAADPASYDREEQRHPPREPRETRPGVFAEV